MPISVFIDDSGFFLNCSFSCPATMMKFRKPDNERMKCVWCIKAELATTRSCVACASMQTTWLKKACLRFWMRLWGRPVRRKISAFLIIWNQHTPRMRLWQRMWNACKWLKSALVGQAPRIKSSRRARRGGRVLVSHAAAALSGRKGCRSVPMHTFSCLSHHTVHHEAINHYRSPLRHRRRCVYAVYAIHTEKSVYADVWFRIHKKWLS